MAIRLRREHFVKPPSYIIFIKDGIIKALNCLTQEIEFAGIDASAVIQRAVNQVAGKWGVIFFKEGVFDLERTIKIPDIQDLGLVLLGSGYKTSRPTRFDVKGDFWAFELERTEGFSADLLFQGFCIRAESKGVGKGIRLSAPVNLYRVNLQGVRFENLEQAICGNPAGAWSNAHIIDCHFWGCGVEKGLPAVELRNFYLLRVLNCDWTGDARGTLLYARKEADLWIMGCRFESPDAGSGHLVDIDSVHKLHVINNLFQRVRTDSAGLIVRFGRDARILYNSFDYIVTGATNTHAIWFPNLHYNMLIRGNAMREAYTWGIRSDIATSTGIITENYLDPATTNPISIAGAPIVVKRNLNYVTENSGTATFTAGVTSVTISHGLATTPKIVLVAPHHSEIADIRVIGKTATDFTVEVTTAPTADRTFDWYAEV